MAAYVVVPMFLLNDALMGKYRADQRLGITPFSQKNVRPTCYYFRLGEYVEYIEPSGRHNTTINIGPNADSSSKSGSVLLKPHRYVLVRSLESFRLSHNVLGVFGPTSSLARRGLRLNHSLFIDPKFEGVLELGLENLLDVDVEIRYADEIGKVAFFDVTDTYPIGDIADTASAEDWQRRQRLAGNSRERES